MADVQKIKALVDEKADKFVGVANQVWSTPELGFKEEKSAAALIAALESEGFKVTTGLAGIPTAFVGVWGEGHPAIGLLGEFDALPGLSQEAGNDVHTPVCDGGNGHGCGHNLLGTGSLAAAIAVKEYLKGSKKPGTIIYFGCPAEEGGSAKAFMARDGVFKGVDIALSWHPNQLNSVWAFSTLANVRIHYFFKGVSAHAGTSPHLGRSALDAVELMSVGCNYLREHVIPEARIHYAYIDAGGSAPNVVQDHATVRYEVRTPYVRDLRDLFDRVVDVARGAALMTGTTLEVELAMAFTEYVPNKALGAIASEAMQEVGAPQWDEADFQLARQFLESYDPETRSAVEAEIRRTYGDRAEAVLQRPLATDVIPFDPAHIRLQAGSTDVGDVGYAAPTLNLLVATACVGNVGHSWQMTAQACSPLAHKGLLTAAQAMALSAVRTMHCPEAIAAAKAEVLARNGGKYTCPLPDSVKPPLDTY